jgi:hypothetical protein
MKRTVLLSFLLFGIVVSLLAQRVNRTYNDVSLSEALLQLSQEQSDYTISFIYNELEDFRITTTIHNKKLPEAIQQMIGFYPIRMTVDPNHMEIFVECTHKTNRHLTGTIVDEQGLPLAYANVATLNPLDSTLFSNGVSNESGYFAIPFEQDTVLARISFIGYKTIYKQCVTENVGIIQLEPETYTINGIQVKGERTIVKAENGHLTYNIPQLLEILPADNAYEALTRIPGMIDGDGGLSFAGHSVTLIINGKPTSLSAEQVIERLRQMPASMLAKAEVMASAPAKYHVHGMAINVVTKDYSGTNQYAGQLQGFYRQNKYGYGKVKGTMLYQHGQLGIDASYSYGYGTAYGQVEHEAHHPLGDQRVDYFDKTERKNQTFNHSCRIGLDYAFPKDSRLNVAYTGTWTSNDATNTSKGLETSVQKSETHTYLHNVDASYTSPFGLELSASYTNYQNPRTQHLDGHLYDTERNLYVDSRQRISKWLFAADQTHDMGKGWELNYGVEAQLTNNTSYQTTREANGQQLADATSRVGYDERIFDIYAGFSKQITPSFSIETSLGAEQYQAPKWNEWRWYPTLNALWNVDKNNMLNLSFSSQNVFPNYWSTMSSIFYSSAYSEIWGNPDLRPNSEYDIDFIWQLRQRYTFIAYAKYLPDYSVQLAYQPSDRMAVIMKETNFNYMNVYGLQASARFSAGKWLNGTVMATGNYRHDKSDHFFDLPFDRKQVSVILSSTTAIRFSQRHDIRLILNPSFQSKAIQGIYDIDPYFRLHVSLRWMSDNKKWSVTAAGQNITNSRLITHSRLANQDYTMRVWMEYPNASLTVICRIGGFKDRKTKTVDTSRMGY